MTAPCRPPWSTCTRAREVGTVVPSTEEETEAQTGVATCGSHPASRRGPSSAPKPAFPTRIAAGPTPWGPCRVAPRGERGENGHVTRGWEWGSPGTKPAPSLAQKAGCPSHPDMGSHLPKPRDYRGPHCGIYHTDHAHERAHVCTRMHNTCMHTLHTRYMPPICTDMPCTTHTCKRMHMCTHNTHENTHRAAWGV